MRNHIKRRTFLSAASLTASFLVANRRYTFAQPFESGTETMNWARSIRFQAKRIAYPTNEAEVQELVRQAKKVKAIGSGHSFSLAADTEDTLISTRDLNKPIRINTFPDGTQSVTVQSGIRYSDLGKWLGERGLAIANYASLPHISVAGSIATATHPSGTKNLAGDVLGIRLVTTDGEVKQFRIGQEDFDGVVVGLGALGIATEIELKVEPEYLVAQNVYLNMTWENMLDNFDAIMSGAYSPSIFLHWQHKDVSEVWYKQKIAPGTKPSPAQPELFGAKLADKDVHPVIELSAENCTEQMGVPGKSYERLPHFRPEFSPASGKELHTEIFVPWKHAVAAISDLRKLADLIGPLLYITELRSVQCDPLWMSTAYGTPGDRVLAIQFSWKFDDAEFTQAGVMKVVPELQKILAPYQARPHWGKLFTWDHTYFRKVYPKFDAFLTLANNLDPQGKLKNAYLAQVLYGDS